MEYIRKPVVKYSLIAVAVFLFFWLVVGQSVSTAESAPNFTLENQEGETISLDDYRGQVVIVNFWATWCPPCKAEIPGFVDLYEEYKDDGLVIIGVSLDQTGWNEVHPFIEEYEINYPIVVGNQEIAEAYGNIRSIPTTFVLDQDGAIAKKYVGYQPDEVFEEDYLALQ